MSGTGPPCRAYIFNAKAKKEGRQPAREFVIWICELWRDPVLVTAGALRKIEELALLAPLPGPSVLSPEIHAIRCDQNGPLARRSEPDWRKRTLHRRFAELDYRDIGESAAQAAEQHPDAAGEGWSSLSCFIAKGVLIGSK